MEGTRIFANMKVEKGFLLALAGSLLLSACTAKEGIEIRDAWMRPAAQGDNGAVYFTLHNYSAVDDELIGVSAKISQTVEFHESKLVNDVMTMQMLSSVPVSSGEDVVFVPGGLHIMLVGLKKDVNPGESFEITLHFRVREDLVVTVYVQEGAEDHSDHDG